MLKALLIAGLLPAATGSIKHRETREASSSAALAYYLYTDTDKKVKELEKRYISPKMIRIGGAVIWIAGVIENKYITYGWEF